jgi:tripartite-type tricarboxylate transporter receptor subunit TctC
MPGMTTEPRVDARSAADMRAAHALAIAGLLLLGHVTPEAHAQSYPMKPVRLVSPSSAGGGSDIIARILAPKLAERIGQQVVVENRAGAGTVIGSDHVAKSAPDGYTLLLGISTLATNPALLKKMPYDAVRDLAPITQVAQSPNVLVVHPSVPVHSVKELIAFVRARPGQLTFASAGVGTNPHMTMELFRSMAKLEIVHVPYKGSAPAITDLVGGHVAMMSATALTGIPQIRAGRLRGLGVSSAKRSASAPELPTIAEAGVPGYEATQWYGLLAPAGTPSDVIKRLHAETVKILQLPDVKARLAGDGAEPVGDTPEEFGRFIAAELAKWAKVAREAKIQPE